MQIGRLLKSLYMDNLQTNIAVVTQQRAKHTKTRYYILAMIFGHGF